MRIAWHITRTGGTYESFEDDYYDLVSLVAGPGDILRDMRSPILCGRLGLDHEHDGEARVTDIISNPAKIPADDAITILLAVHQQVEHCGDGEVMALPVCLPLWLADLFPPLRAADLHTDLIYIAKEREGQI